MTTSPPDPGTNTPTELAEWTTDFGEDTKAYVNNKGWKTPNDLLVSYQNLEKLTGGSKRVVALPDEDADESTVNRFYDNIGRPESSDQYNLDMPDETDDALMTWFRDSAYEVGLTRAQAGKMFASWNEMAQNRIEQTKDQMRTKGENEIADLKREWGQKYDENIVAGKNAVRALGYDEEKLSIMEEKLGTSEMLKLFSVLGSKMGEDSFEDGSRSNASFGNNKAEARVQMEELRNDAGFMERYMRGDREALAKFTRTMQNMYS